MSGDSDGNVGIVLDNPAIQPMEEMAAAGQSYKDKFESILTAFDDERTWWDAVDDLLDTDGDFADKVSNSSAFLLERRILQSSLSWCAPYSSTHAGCNEGASGRGGLEAAGHCRSDGGPPSGVGDDHGAPGAGLCTG